MKYGALLLISSVAFLFGCQNSGDQKQYGDAAATDSTSTVILTGDSVKLVKTAGINLKVKNTEQSIKSIAAIVKQFGGSVTYQNFNSEEEKRNELKLSPDSLLVVSVTVPRADITLRLPSQNLEDFMFSAADLGYYTGNSTLRVYDKSLLYLENALKQKSRLAATSKPPLRNNKSVPVKETIAVQDEAIDQQIANKTIDRDVQYSIVNLTVFQNPIVRKEVVANTDIADYNLPFQQRLRNAVLNGWTYFIEVILALAHMWVFLITGGAAYYWYKHLLQKRKPVFIAQKQE